MTERISDKWGPLDEDEVVLDVRARIRQDKAFVHDEDQIAVLAGMLARLADSRAALAAERERADAASSALADVHSVRYVEIEAKLSAERERVKVLERALRAVAGAAEEARVLLHAIWDRDVLNSRDPHDGIANALGHLQQVLMDHARATSAEPPKERAE